jgi:hypothetical protein
MVPEELCETLPLAWRMSRENQVAKGERKAAAIAVDQPRKGGQPAYYLLVPFAFLGDIILVPPALLLLGFAGLMGYKGQAIEPGVRRRYVHSSYNSAVAGFPP